MDYLNVARSLTLYVVSLALVWVMAMPTAGAASPAYQKGLEAAADFHYAESLGYFRAAAEAGDPNAQRTLGLMLLYGHQLYGAEIPTNFAQAVRWLQTAASQGCEVSTLVLKRLNK